jgi:hypothetical protein
MTTEEKAASWRLSHSVAAGGFPCSASRVAFLRSISRTMVAEAQKTQKNTESTENHLTPD